jgi:hypothetical protein
VSRFTSFGLNAAITCRRALGCWVAIGGGRRGTAGGVSGCLSRVGFRGKGCSRSPRRGRRLPVGYWQTCRVGPHPTMVSLDEAIYGTRWPQHPRRNRRVRDQAVFAVVVGPWRTCPIRRDVSVESLATHLIINRCSPAHDAHRRGASAGPASTWCVHNVDEYVDKQPEIHPATRVLASA